MLRMDIANVDYSTRGLSPDIYLFGRDALRNRRKIRIKGFKPYYCKRQDNESEVCTEVDIFGHPLVKREVDWPRDVQAYRGVGSFEANIPFGLRYLIDQGLYCGVEQDSNGQLVPTQALGVEPKVMYMDIEVSSPPEVVPRAEVANYPITTIQYGTNYDDSVKINIVNDELINGANVVATEKDLLNTFVNDVKEIDPDIIWVWFGHLYDWPYIFKRARMNGMFLSGLSPLNWVNFREDFKQVGRKRYNISVHGRALVDGALWYQVKHKPEGKPDSMDLKVLVKKHTEFEYEDYGDRIEQLLKEDTDTLVNYCHNEIVGMKLFDQADGITAYFDRARRHVGGILERPHVAGHIIYTRMLRVAMKRQVRLPTIVFGSAELSGAQVLTPRVGLWNNVAIFDVKSMYPSFIMTYNLSPETKDSSGDIDIGNGVKFKSKPLGVLAESVKMEFNERERLKALRKDLPVESLEWKKAWAEEQAAKYVTNAYYGMSKHIDPDIARSITFLGRETINYLAEFAEGIGCPAVYGDTDSVFLKVKDIDNANELLPELNEAISEHLEDKFTWNVPSMQIEIQLDKFLDKVFFSLQVKGGEAKKRWAAHVTYDDGPCSYIKVTGFPARRTDSSNLTRQVQRTFFDILLRDGTVEEAVQYVGKLVREFDTIPMEDILIPHGFGKPLEAYDKETVWQRGIKYTCNNFGVKYHEDRKYGVLFTQRIKGYPSTDVMSWEMGVPIPEDMKDRIVVDKDEMIKKTLKNKLEPNFLALKKEWMDVTSTTKKMVLDGWLA